MWCVMLRATVREQLNRLSKLFLTFVRSCPSCLLGGKEEEAGKQDGKRYVVYESSGLE